MSSIPNLLRVVAAEIEGFKMPVIYSTAVHAARMGVVRDSIDAGGAAGYLQIYTDSYQTRLASIALGYPADSTAVIAGDSMTFAGFPREDVAVDAGGTAALARIVDSNGVVAVSGITVGTQNADIVIERTLLVAGETFRINSAKLGNVPALPPIVVDPEEPDPVLPAVSLIVPSTGVAGIPMTITGTAFGTTGTVKFGTVTATVTSWTDTVIACTVPVSVNSVAVSVTNSVGTSNTATFTYVPEAPPVGARELGSYRVWPNYVVRSGPNAVDFNSAVSLRWKNVNGDWLDANQLAQGTTPWYTLVVPKNSVGYLEYSITTLAERWRTGENRGAYFLCDATTNVASWVQWCGTYGVNPPQLVVSRSGHDDVTIRGDLCAFTVVSTTAAFMPSNLDTGLQARLSRQTRQVLHFHGLNALEGTITSAKLRLHANSTDDIYPLNIKMFEADPPPLLLGGAGLPPVYGLAAEVGETNLPNHPDVLAAGDFRESNWNSTPGRSQQDTILVRGGRPAGMFDYVSMAVDQYNKTTVVEDPDHPGRYYMRTCMAQGNLGGGQWKCIWHGSGPADTGYMPDPAGYEPEIYVRCEIWLESDSFWSRDSSFKFSPVGMEGQYGKGTAGGGWDGGSVWLVGSGQSPSDGRRVWNTEYNQWILHGHTMRGHTLRMPHPTHNAYPGVLGLGIAPSHLGPYDTLRDDGIYGTEQNLRIGNRGQDHCIPMDRWVTIEAHCRVNTIDMTNLDADGNGVARNDGVWEMWLDGVHVGGRYNLAWFRHPSMGIKANWLMAYHGGTVEADHDLFWRIRNFCIARRYIGPKV